MESKEKKFESKWPNKNISYKIEFKRLNKIAFISGLLFILLALINIPFLYDPELNQITFNISGKPTFGLGGNITFYVFVGIIPALIGLIIVLFSIFTARKKEFLLSDDGLCLYKKKEFVFKDKLQQIRLGRRHQRFVIWVPVAIMIFLVFLLLDYMNFLAPSFDITTTFFGVEYSVKTMLLLNIFFIIGVLLLFTLFPRRLCRIDTSEYYIKFNYTNLNIQQISETPADLPYIRPFEALSTDKTLGEKHEKGAIGVPEHYPEVLKKQITANEFNHLPLVTLIFNIGLFLIIFLPQFIPNFFLGGFTFRIEYFLAIAAFYFTARTLQNSWYSNQNIQLIKDQSNLFVKRSNRIFGDSVDFFANIDEIQRAYKPRTPNFFEYLLLFFPIMQLVWLLAQYITFADYFFTQNPYTVLYFLVIVGIFLFLATEYLFPKPILSVTPKAQSPTLTHIEKYNLYFPKKTTLTKLPFRPALKHKTFLKNSYPGLLLILVPVLFTLIWITLHSLGLMPHISETIF
ncbi:MAG: hypothetical protein HWN65_03135 [Candidatus Helarchaeota archaeon]|nr:hypothetical protein [Candidatus Helarchaeota archaeon]